MTQAVEINFDGLVGPTHNYAGLSLGNVASRSNAGQASRPREAALQGLAKMAALMELGLTQGFLPPQPRPNVRALRALGFSGTPEQVCASAAAADPVLFANLCSASCMWTANAATVSPAADTADGRTHFTVANLVANLHRSTEAVFTQRVLETVFPDRTRFAVHPALPGGMALGDEGAANFMRLARRHGAPGVEVFVHGVDRGGRFPARQSRRAFEAVARSHGLDPARCLHVEQSDTAIQSGAFHNDVVAVANETVLFTHEQAFADPDGLSADLQRLLPEVEIISVPANRVSLADAVSSYLFNSQLVSLPEGGMALVLPGEARENAAVWGWLQDLLGQNTAIRQLVVLDVRESMRNGGGPACLRLRVAVPAAHIAAIDPRFLLNAERLDQLQAYVASAYPESLAPADLLSPGFQRDAHDCLRGLLDVIGAPELYDGLWD